MPATLHVIPTDPFHNAGVAATLMAEANPRDMSDRHVYLVAEAHLKAARGLDGLNPGCNDYVAFTGAKLSEKLEPYLRQSGCWSGPGFCSVFRAGLGFAKGFGVLVHEAGHDVVFRSRYFTEYGQIRTNRLERIARDPKDNAHLFGDQSHGPEFVRATLHLWHRTNLLLAKSNIDPISIESLGIAGDRYGMLPAESYRMTLHSELVSMTNQSVLHVLLSRPPELFVRLCAEDLTSGSARGA